MAATLTMTKTMGVKPLNRRIASLLLAMIMASLTACGNAETLNNAEELYLEPDKELVEIINTPTANTKSMTVNDTPLTVVAPDEYKFVNTTDNSVTLRRVNTDANETIDISYFCIDNSELGATVINPLSKYELSAEAFPTTEVSDVSMYITGEKTITGVSMRNYVDLSTYDYTLSRAVVPQMFYVFDIGNNQSLVIRIDYLSDYLDNLLDTLILCESGKSPDQEMIDKLGDSEYIDSAIEQIALAVTSYTYYGESE